MPPDRRRRALLLLMPLLPLAGLPLAACDRVTSAASAGGAGRNPIDAEWHRKTLVDGLLARWLAVAPTPSGMFLTHFDRQWKPLDENAKGVDGVAQSRLVYAMAVGYELSRDRRYLDAARKGADFLLNALHDPVHGGFFYAVGADGKPRGEHKPTYGQAFAILALATLARVEGDAKEAAEHRQRWQAAALRAWEDVDLGLRDPLGGLYPEAARDFTPPGPGSNRNQNPLMHMFEALLALYDATGGTDVRVRTAARKLGDFVVYKLLEGRPDGSARIPEWYDGNWKPLTTSDGYIDLGHQFEWVHLLIAATERGISPIYASVADRLLQYAQEKGYDETDGGAYERASVDKDHVDKTKGEWQQYECLHCFITGASVGGKPELWRRFEQTLSLVRTELIDTDKGGGCRKVRCAEERLDPYHMTSMHLAAIRAAG